MSGTRTIGCLVVGLLAGGCESSKADYGSDGYASDWDSGGYWEESDSDTDADTDSDADTGAPTDTDTGDTGDTGVDDECDEETPVQLYLSPDDSNSMSSPVQARNAILAGDLYFEAVNIRTWEFMNYYGFDYEAPETNPVRVSASMRLDPDAADRYSLQIGIASREMTSNERDPMNLVLVLDTSGSMSGDSMDRLRDVCIAIAGNLKVGDLVSIVEWSSDDTVLLEEYAVEGPDDEYLLSVIDGLRAGGGTDLFGGLSTGYAVAGRNFDTTRINRLVLVSDGGANLGVTSEAIIADNAADEAQEGIYLVGVGVGDATTYHDTLMDAVTDLGKGASVFIDTQAEAERVFGDGFLSVMEVAARDVQVELELPPGFEIERFSGEQISTNPREVEPQHLAPNDAMVFYQTMTTCAPESATADSTVRVTARFKDPVTYEDGSISLETTFGQLLGEDTALLDKGAAIFTYAEALKAVQAREPSASVAVEAARAAIDLAMRSNEDDRDLEEISRVLAALE